jgi:hypothetical protein
MVEILGVITAVWLRRCNNTLFAWALFGLLPISWSSDNGNHLFVGTEDEGSGRSSSIGKYLSQVAANSAGV